VQNATGEPLLVIPSHGNLERGIAFARSQAGWLRERLKRLPDRVPFEVGEEIPLRGVPHVLKHSGTSRGTVQIATPAEGAAMPEILVSGGREHMSRRLVDWLKTEARRDLEPPVLAYAANLGVRPKRITVRDQTSRWGSCSASGTLSFSWRLVLAPPFVLDYLAAHEVTHMVEMNHSARFWKTLDEIAPHTGQAESWLKRNGTSLFRYGPR
jgi:predicted metal-dependent hydrolase